MIRVVRMRGVEPIDPDASGGRDRAPERRSSTVAAGRRGSLSLRRFVGVALPVCAMAALTGCATMSADRIREDIRTGAVDGAYIDGVPFVPQLPDQCGPAALAMVAGAWGVDLDPEEIAGEIHLPSIRGTLNVDLAAYSRRLGMWVRSYRGSIQDLKQKVRAGAPVIVLTRVPSFGRPRNHYFVVVGFDNRRDVLIAHSGTRTDQVLPRRVIDRWWRANRRWSLLIVPPDRIEWDLSADEENDLAVWFEGQGRLDDALAHYERSLVLVPEQGYVLVNRGNALAALGRIEEAESAYRDALAVEADHVAGLNNLAFLLATSGNGFAEAEALARRAVEIDAAARPNSLETLAYVLQQSGEFDAADAAVDDGLQEARERGRNDWVALLTHRREEIGRAREAAAVSPAGDPDP